MSRNELIEIVKTRHFDVYGKDHGIKLLTDQYCENIKKEISFKVESKYFYCWKQKHS